MLILLNVCSSFIFKVYLDRQAPQDTREPTDCPETLAFPEYRENPDNRARVVDRVCKERWVFPDRPATLDTPEAEERYRPAEASPTPNTRKRLRLSFNKKL